MVLYVISEKIWLAFIVLLTVDLMIYCNAIIEIWFSYLLCVAVVGVYLAERMNYFLGSNWESFSGQNYFDVHGLFLSTLWSGPLLLIAVMILVSY